jgi:hypothetical protein
MYESEIASQRETLAMLKSGAMRTKGWSPELGWYDTTEEDTELCEMTLKRYLDAQARFLNRPN